MYEQQTPFELADYVGLSSFLNNFLYKSIQENIFGELNVPENAPMKTNKLIFGISIRQIWK